MSEHAAETAHTGTDWLRAHPTAVKATGTRDLSAIGEHHAYPTGYGCEVCA